MLFDLRSRGRRRTIQVVYLFLAVLIGVGLIGFGVGTGGGGNGPLNAISGGGGTATGLARYQRAVTKAQRRAAAAPGDPAAWDALATASYTLAGLGTNYVTGSGYTAGGAKQLAIASRAWARYLALAPAHPDESLARDIVAAFGVSPGVQEYATAESAAEVVANASGATFSDFATLAELAYLAHETTRGDLAAARAVHLAPVANRATLKTELAAIRLQATGATGASGATG